MNHEQMESQILQLTRQSFKSEVVESPTPVLIDFWAPWCGPCRAMKPILSEAVRLLAGRVRVAQVNVDEERELGAAFGIRSIPTCLLLQGNQVIGSFVGVVPAKQLVAEVLSKLSQGEARGSGS